MQSDVSSIEQIINIFTTHDDLLSNIIGNTVSAILIAIIGLRLAAYSANTINNILSEKGLDNTLCTFLSLIVRYTLISIVLIMSLSQLGVQIASLIAVLSAGSLAIGLALKGALSNFAAGVLLTLLRPFKIGHYIEAAGIAGTVESIQLFHCILKTADNKQITVPNRKILNSNIINFSRQPERRIDLVVRVSYQADLNKVKQILERVVLGSEFVLKYPEPVIAVSELASSSVNLVVRPWVKTPDNWVARCALTESIKIALDEAGIKIPYQQVSVHNK